MDEINNDEQIFPEREKEHAINRGRAEAYLGTYKGNGDIKHFNEIYRQFADRKQILEDMAGFCRISLDFYYSIPDSDPIKAAPEVVAGAMYHKPDWFSLIEVGDNGLKLKINANVLGAKERVLYQNLMMGDNLNYCFNTLSLDRFYLNCVSSFKGKHIVRGLDCKLGDEVKFYLHGKPYDINKSYIQNREESHTVNLPTPDEQES